ncbi:MAG: hypothetical protein LBP38_05220, partial [Desulfovibrio sp.]|nr:hypothetical protein [Desulfovibrio sp.]
MCVLTDSREIIRHRQQNRRSREHESGGKARRNRACVATDPVSPYGSRQSKLSYLSIAHRTPDVNELRRRNSSSHYGPGCGFAALSGGTKSRFCGNNGLFSSVQAAQVGK